GAGPVPPSDLRRPAATPLDRPGAGPGTTVLLADEAVSALDVTVRATVLDLLTEVTAGDGPTLVLVSHDLSVIRRTCQDVAVLRQGRLVETGPVEDVFTAPQQDSP